MNEAKCLKCLLALLVHFALVLDFKVLFAENIDIQNNGSQYAWSKNLGWLNLEPGGDGGIGVEVLDNQLTGYIWCENGGWISLNHGGRKVLNDGIGNLTGYAWGENVGWISFSCNNTNSCDLINYGVIINPDTGEFRGNAWSENIGWINFSPATGNGANSSWRGDLCPNDPNKTTPGICGCGVSDVDSDSDSVADCNDICAGGDDTVDTDSDGVPDFCDTFPDDPSEWDDTDGDGLGDNSDPYPGAQVPSNPGGDTEVSPAPSITMTLPDVTVGGIVTVEEIVSQAPASYLQIGSMSYDINFTGVFNGLITICIDYDENDVLGDESQIVMLHYNTPIWLNVTTLVDTVNDVVCGETNSLSPIIVAELDTDNDGVPDSIDICPNDPSKTEPGQCGCGTPDTDTDGDGTADCDDLCVNDPNKIDPGTCGCGIEDVQTDSDNDGITDCVDSCPDFPNPLQIDLDGDGIGKACDLDEPNPIYDNSFNAPHNQTNDITCVDCHAQPFPGTVDSIEYKQAIQDSCLSTCHTENEVKPHAGASFVPPAGIWEQYCTDCHEPHFQMQLSYLGTNADDLLLATGMIGPASSFRVDESTKTTTFSYSDLVADANWNDPTTWNKKNDNQTYNNGLILIRDTISPKDSYEVETADGSTITLKGFMDPVAAGGTFGLIYGQLMKSNVNGRDVKFFDPKTENFGFINIDGSGICQVCHTDTAYFQNDGSLQDHPTPTYEPCNNCHKPKDGFQGINP